MAPANARMILAQIFLGSTALIAIPAAAQTGNAPPPEATLSAAVEGAKVYLPADFTAFAPRNALDMLRQVPGFVIRQAMTEERGLGEASGNVLINGQRISGKSNDAVTELGRIPAANVVRIEIVDGSTLNIAGFSGQVANIIARSDTGLKGQFSWQPEFRARNTSPIFLRGSISATQTTGAFTYTAELRNDAFSGGFGGFGTVFDKDDAVLEEREQRFRSTGNQPKLSGSLKYDPAGSLVANLNLSYQLFHFDLLDREERRLPGQPERFRRFTSSEREHNYEIGGDVAFGLGPGNLKLIGLRRFEHSPIKSSVLTSFADGAPSTGNRFFQTGDETETVARAEYRLATGKSEWQLSGEGAFNVLDNVSRFFTLLPNGEFQESPLPNGTATVKEDRGEAMLTFSRPLSPTLSIQLSGGGEYSQLSQTGSLGRTRTFWRPKGFVSAAWKASPRLDLSARLERDVGQLNFFDFLASENINNGSSNAGNPDLVPPQSWEFEMEGTRNFGAEGSATLKLYAHLINDIVDFIPIGATGESRGNLDQATLLGLEWKSTTNFAPWGWQGAKLDLRVILEKSRLKDPLTGEKRPISGIRESFVEAGLRHDVPNTDWAWGANLQHFRPNPNVRLTQRSFGWEGPFFAGLFVEHKDVLGLTVRGSVFNLFGTDNVYERIVHSGRRTDPISFVERYHRTIGPIFSFSLRGNI